MSETGGAERAVVSELERVAKAASAGIPSEGAPPAPSVRLNEPLPAPETVSAVAAPPRPSGEAVNALWRAAVLPRRGLKGRVARFLLRLVRPEIEAQERFNSAQVRLDNELTAWIEQRFAVTHRHYDEVLGQVGRHLGEIDTRHLMLQDEVVKHTHDLVRRIDLVLGRSEASRMEVAQTLRDVRDRLAELERRLGGA